MTAISWQSWAPPLDPPTAGGLPVGEGQRIADAWWDEEPHEAAAQMWEAYAGMLPPTPVVAQVATGSQSVSYSPPAPSGEAGVAMARAAWHRSFLGTLHSAVLESTTHRPADDGWPGWWEVDEL